MHISTDVAVYRHCMNNIAESRQQHQQGQSNSSAERVPWCLWEQASSQTHTLPFPHLLALSFPPSFLLSQKLTPQAESTHSLTHSFILRAHEQLMPQ